MQFLERVAILGSMHYVVHMTTAWETGTIPEFGLSDRLRKAREFSGMDIKAFAAHIGVSRNTIGNYESADYDKKRQESTIKLWAMGSGVPLAWIQAGTVPTGPDDGDTTNHGDDVVIHHYLPGRRALALAAA